MKAAGRRVLPPPPYFWPVTRLRSALQFVLVLALVASTQGLLLAQSSWLVNQEWIAEVLCENPETDCDGKCQLMDRMEKMGHGEHSHDEPATLLELALSVRASVTERTAAPAPPSADARGPVARDAHNSGREASLGVFHPPRTETTA